MRTTHQRANGVSRRGFMAGAAALCAGGGVALGAELTATTNTPPDVPPESYRIARGRIRQSVMGWCYDPIPTEDLIEACHRMGMPAMEGIDRKCWA